MVPNKIWPWSHAATTEAEGRQFVRQYHRLGADFIKIYDEIHPDVFLAIVDEAAQLEIPVVGHVPLRVDLEVASDAGMQGIEHLSGVDLALSPDRIEIRDTYVSNTEAITDPAAFTAEATQHYMEMGRSAHRSFDAELAPALYERLKMNGTWQTPTLTVLRNVSQVREMGELVSDRMSYLPPMFRFMWDPAGDPRFHGFDDEDWQSLEDSYHRASSIVGDMNRAGVRIIAGTDVLNPYCIPGFSLHDELELLVEAGLTPMQALQAATRNAAEFSGLQDSLGTIEVGKIADLVLLEENPVTDIRNTTSIYTVIIAGQVLDRLKLDSVLSQIRDTASSASSN